MRSTSPSVETNRGFLLRVDPRTDAGAFLMHSTTYDDDESLVILSQWLAEREQHAIRQSLR